MFHWVVFVWGLAGYCCSGNSNFLSKCFPLNLVFNANIDFQDLAPLSMANGLKLMLILISSFYNSST